MPTYLALLRGINVGGNKTVPMAKLKVMFESLGFTNVKTYINSGNVIFEASAKTAKGMAEKIEKEIVKTFGFESKTLVRDAKSVLKLCASLSKKLANDEIQRTDVLFLWDKFDSKATLKLIKMTKGVDVLEYFPGAIVWNFQRKHYTKSSMHDFIGTEVYKHMTARNVNTVRKLAALLEA